MAAPKAGADAEKPNHARMAGGRFYSPNFYFETTIDLQEVTTNMQSCFTHLFSLNGKSFFCFTLENFLKIYICIVDLVLC